MIKNKITITTRSNNNDTKWKMQNMKQQNKLRSAKTKTKTGGSDGVTEKKTKKKGDKCDTSSPEENLNFKAFGRHA